MDKDEIDATLAKAEKQAIFDFTAKPIFSWLGAACLWPVIWAFGAIFGIVEAAFVVAGLISSFEARGDWQEFKAHRAATIWTKLRSQPRYSEAMSPASRELSTQIGDIYQQDLLGEFFPLSQALRLLDTHHRQQQRSRLVSVRLRDLENVHIALASKIKQLHALGAEAQDGEQNLRQIEADTAALKTLKDQIEASCRRLEMILISVQTAFKTRQLQREISELGTRATPAATLSTLAPENELSDIERQIGREIETFLQLERETERHFG